VVVEVEEPSLLVGADCNRLGLAGRESVAAPGADHEDQQEGGVRDEVAAGVRRSADQMVLLAVGGLDGTERAVLARGTHGRAG
jgi:hypothetical protein